MAAKEIVLFRHAHKESWTNDPDLSDHGHRQALLIVELIHRNKLPKPDRLLSSPKKRAQQTLMPIQEELQVPLLIEPVLDERSSQETGIDFETRIKGYLENNIPRLPESCLFLCTHLDWLEVFSWAAPLMVDISSEILHLPPAHYYHFKIENSLETPWKLIQKGGIK